MISKETENVQSSQEIENAFRAITAADRPYVTKEELYAVSQQIYILEVIFEIFAMNIYNLKMFIYIFAEPYEGDGRLLRGENETVRRSENRETNHGCSRLYRIYAHTISKLIYNI